MSNNSPTAAPVLEFRCPVGESQGQQVVIRRQQPAPEIAFTATTSVITFSHEQGMTCHRCNSFFRLALGQVQFGAMRWGIYPAERPSGLVIAPKGVIQ